MKSGLILHMEKTSPALEKWSLCLSLPEVVEKSMAQYSQSLVNENSPEPIQTSSLRELCWLVIGPGSSIGKAFPPTPFL